MKIAVYSLSLKDKTPEEVIALAAQYGCRAIEWWCRENGHVDRNDLEKSAGRVGALMKSSGLETAGLAPYFKYCETRDEMRRIFAAARAVGARMVRSHSLVYPAESPSIAGLMRAQRKWLEENVIPAAEEFDARIAIEQHMNQVCCTPNACRELVDGFPPERAGIIYDPGNSLVEGFTSPEYAVAVFGEYLCHVHVKSCRPAASGKPYRGRKFPVEFGALSEGDLDWARIVAVLKKAGYGGCLSLEALDSRPSEQKMKDDIPFLHKIIASETPDRLA